VREGGFDQRLPESFRLVPIHDVRSVRGDAIAEPDMAAAPDQRLQLAAVDTAGGAATGVLPPSRHRDSADDAASIRHGASTEIGAKIAIARAVVGGS
jgi:hypothetical protein